MGDLTKNFSIAEVRCKCSRCAGLEHPDLPTMSSLLKLQAVRDDMGVPLALSCAIRCVAHNKEVGGAEDSRHQPQFADAFDIDCTDSNLRYRIVASAIKNGFRFVEVCPDHLHLDDRPALPKLITGDDH
jgi:hypothetical protein